MQLLTLTGPGGVGKTRLAVRAAEAVGADAYAEGAAFVSLAPVADAELVAPPFASAAGARSGAEFSFERLAHLLGDHALLLVLDNFEHVAAAAPVVTDLLAACPRLKVLVTSRVALRLSAEQVFAAPPALLPADAADAAPDATLRADAVRLFVHRAQAARPGFVPDADVLPVVAAICRCLDGLPLAIELAAARVNHLSPAALLDRLEHPETGRLPLLTGGPRDQ